MLGICLENVRTQVPLVHNITNYVTVNDVANVLLACGGSPIMADEAEEVEEITSICGGLNINIGTRSQECCLQENVQMIWDIRFYLIRLVQVHPRFVLIRPSN